MNYPQFSHAKSKKPNQLNRLFILALFAFVLNSCDQPAMMHEDNRITRFHDLADKFKDPPVSYRTVPFWVWNEKMDKSQIDEQLTDYKEKGFGGVFVHPRYGLITEYLSDEWFDLVDYSAKKARELDLYLWLYDENSFPSGFGGGHVPAAMPESYNQGTGMQIVYTETFNPDTLSDWIAFFQKSDGKWDWIDSSNVVAGKNGEFALIKKTYYQASKFLAGFPYVDLLIEGVTEKFIEVTMEGYEEILSDEFGKLVPGVFTDEPNISPRSGGNVRWTPAFFDTFRKEWGYDPEPHLVSLFEESGDWKKFRHNYYSLLLKMFIERWSVPWHAYTEANNLEWTGHYWEHGWPSPVHGGDNMAMYPYHQVPGIDMLFNSVSERPDQFGNVRAVKELSSIANQFHRHRTLSETYGASGYELDFASMKRNGDWQYALGVNLMNQHLSYQSALGDRKHDFPQTFSYHTPWWDEYREHADYYARLSLALSSGYQLNEILVLEPTTTAWAYYNPLNEKIMNEKVGDPFTDFVDKLELHKVQYDLASEKTMRDFGTVSSGNLEISHMKYPLLILPPGLENLDRSTFILLEDFLSGGGEILDFTKGISLINGSVSDEVKDLFVRYSEQVQVVDDPGSIAQMEILQDPEIVFIDPEKNAEKVYWMRRQFSEGDILFFANFERGVNKQFEISLPASQSVIELDPVSGDFYEPEHYSTEKGLKIRVDLSDAGSRLYFVGNKKPRNELKQWPVLEGGKPVDAIISETRRMAPNVLVLDYCRLTEPSDIASGSEAEYFYKIHDRIYQKHGFPDNPWVSSVQFKTEILDRDTFGMNSGFTVEYKLSILPEVNTGNIDLAVERPGLYEIRVNGTRVETDPERWYTDKGMKLSGVGSLLKSGENTISLTGKPFSVHHELAPVFLLGNFAVWPAEEGWVIGSEVPLGKGSWKSAGMPFYPGEVSYTKKFTAENTDSRFYLEAGQWKGAAITVKVNDSEERLLWPPYRMDISDLIQKGENRVSLKVIGSLKSLYGPHHNVTREGIVTPWSFKYAPETLPPGKEYDLPEYGLFTDFTIMQLQTDS